jgi:NTP pyrophosphatase (non-canonical NTP hydrolase)
MISDHTLERLLSFRDERDWRQFHTFKSLAVSISLEAAELLEIVQWVPDSNVADVVSKQKAQICNEMADIAIYLSYLAHDLGVDLDVCVQKKLLINEEKYPLDKAKGHATKYDRLPPT